MTRHLLRLCVLVACAAVLAPRAPAAGEKPDSEKVARFVRLLGSGRVKERRQAALWLSTEPPAAKAAVAALTRGVADADSEVRLHCINALSTAGPEAKSALPAIIKAVKDPNSGVRWVALRALGRVGKGDPAAAEALFSALDEKEEHLLRMVLWAVCDLKTGAAKAAPKLEELLSHKSPGVRVGAAMALYWATGKREKSLPVIKECVEQAGPAASLSALNCLAIVSDDAELIKPHVLAALRHDNGGMLSAAASGVGGLKTRGPIVAVLLKHLEHVTPLVRRNAAAMLSSVGTQDKAVVVALEKAAKDPDEEVRDWAGDALLTLRCIFAGEKPPYRIQMVFPSPTALNVTCMSIAAQGDIPITCENDLGQALVTVHFHNTPIDRALERLARRVGAKVTRPKPGELKLVPVGKKYRLFKKAGAEFDAEPLKTVCETIGKLGFTVSCDKELEKRPITLELKDLPLSCVLRHIARQVDATACLAADGSVRIGGKRRGDVEIPPFDRPRDFGRLSAGEANAAKKLVAALSDKQWKKRHAAEKHLLRYGPAALPVLRPCLGTKDLETRVRLERVCRKLGEEAKSGFRRHMEGRLGELTKVEFVNAPVSEIVAFARVGSKTNIVVAAGCDAEMRKELTFTRKTENLVGVLDTALEKVGLVRGFVDGAIYVAKEERKDAGLERGLQLLEMLVPIARDCLKKDKKPPPPEKVWAPFVKEAREHGDLIDAVITRSRGAIDQFVGAALHKKGMQWGLQARPVFHGKPGKGPEGWRAQVQELRGYVKLGEKKIRVRFFQKRILVPGRPAFEFGKATVILREKPQK